MRLVSVSGEFYCYQDIEGVIAVWLGPKDDPESNYIMCLHKSLLKSFITALKTVKNK